MKKTFRKAIAFILVFAFIVGMLPITEIGMKADAASVITLLWPLPSRYQNIWSKYGMRNGTLHAGIDISPCPEGTSVYAAYDGIVINAGWDKSAGKAVTLYHPDISRYTYYYHNSELRVSKGQAVKAGDEIAKSGTTGNSEGPHLHFGIAKKLNSSKLWVDNNSSEDPAPGVVYNYVYNKADVRTYDWARINENDYKIKNVGTNTYLSVDGNANSNAKSIVLASANGWSSQNIHIVENLGSLCYKLTPKNTSRNINTTTYPKSGSEVNIWDNCNHASQRWRFILVSNNVYRIVSAANSSVCLTANGSKVSLQSYTGSSLQHWTLENIAAPTMSISSYYGGKTVKFNCSTSSAKIFYSTDSGSTYKQLSNGGTVDLTASATVKAYAELNGSRSSVVSQTVSVGAVSTPEISTGYTENGMLVSMRSSANADIYYTTDGSEPSQKSKKYTEGFYLTGNAEIRAFAVQMGYKNSGVAEKDIAVSKPGVPTVSLYNTESEIAAGDEATVSWSKSETATKYIVSLYRNGVIVDSCETTGTKATFALEEVGEYSITVKAENFLGESDESYPPVNISAMPDVTVQFVDYDGTLIHEQKVRYGYSAVAPDTPPQRKGYTFNGWSTTNYTNVKKNLTVKAEYSINKYTVEFYNIDGVTRMGVNQRVEYMSSATPPTSGFNLSTGYVFAGWSVKNGSDGTDWQHVDGNMKLIATQCWENPNLPLILNVNSAERNDDGKTYSASVDVINSDLGDVNFKLIGTLKTAAGKMVASTINTEYIASGETKTFPLTIKYTGKATVFEVVAVSYDGDYKTGGAYSTAVSSSINDWTEWEWSEWSEWSTNSPTSGDDVEIEKKTQYRARNKDLQTTTNQSTLSGYTLRTDVSSNPKVTYGSWSGWSDSYAAKTSTQDVETRSVEATPGKTQYRYYTYYIGSYGNHFCPTLAASNMGSTVSTWSNNLHNSGWLDSQLPKTGNTYVHGYSVGHISGCKCPYGAKETIYEYVRNDEKKASGKPMDYYWYETRYVNPTYKTQYRTRSITNTYYFYKWLDWSDWSDTAVSGDETQSQTVYRFREKLPTNDPNAAGEDTTGEVYSASGTLTDATADLCGLTATVMVYKKTNSDPTEEQLEYVGQTVIGEGNSYDFSYRTKEEPSADTGDFIVTLGIEGAAYLVNVDVLKAPGAQHTVTFIADGVELSTQSVMEGESAEVPTVPDKPGYRFVGWSDRTTNIKDSIIISAQYIKREYYSAFVDFENDTISISMYEYGDVDYAPTPESVEGKTFMGWSGFENGDMTVSDSEIHIAQWKTEEFTVRFHDENGEVISEQTVPYGESAERPDDLTVEGMIFEGWETDISWWRVVADMDVYPILRFSETTESPTVESIFTEEYTVALLSSVTPEANIFYTTDGSDPYLFGTEYSDEEGIVISESDMEILAVAAADGMNISPVATFAIDYYAGIEADISYDANGGEAAPPNQVKSFDEPLTLSEAVPTKIDDTFLGWATTATAFEPEYQPGDVYKDELDLTLYAVWQSSASLNADQKIDLIGQFDSASNKLVVTASMINSSASIDSGILVLSYDTDILSIETSNVVTAFGATKVKSYHDEKNGYIGIKYSFNSEIEPNDEKTNVATFTFSLRDGHSMTELNENSIALCSDKAYLRTICSEASGAILSSVETSYSTEQNNLGLVDACVPLVVSPDSPQQIGSEITLSAFGGVDYCFYVIRDEEAITGNIQEGKESECVWIPTESGEYDVYVDILTQNGEIKTSSVKYKISGPELTASLKSPQYESTEIVLNATGGVAYKFYYEFNDQKTILQNTSELSSCVWAPEVSGEYTLFADVTTATGDIVVKSIDFTIENSKWFTASPEGRQEKGNAVKLEAFCCEALLYKFYCKNNGVWTVIKEYSTDSLCEWTPLSSGNYVLYVDAMKADGTIVTMDMDYSVADYLVPFTASLTSPQPSETEIILSAKGGYKYKFYYEQNGKWVSIQDFSTADSCVWKPTEARDYIIYCEARDSANNTVGTYRIPYTITDKYIFTLDKDNVQPVGISLNLKATGGSTYKFYYEYNGAWCKIQDSASNTCMWQPKFAGDYMLYVDIRDENGKTVTCRTQAFTLYDLFTFNTSAYSTTLPFNTDVGFTATGGTTYKFYYEKDGAWVRVQDFSEKNTCTWKPTAAGEYNVYCDIKDSSGSVVSCKRITFNITNPYTFTASVSSPQPTGSTIILSSTGGEKYKFYYEKDGTFVRIQDLSASNTCMWKPDSAGRYMLYVDITDLAGNVIAYKGMEYIIGSVSDEKYTFTTSASSPLQMNTPVELKASGGAQYKFYYEIGGKWVVLRSYSTSDTYTWTPDNADTYVLYVDIKDANGKQVKTLNKEYVVTDLYTVTVNKPVDQIMGSSVVFTATGGSSYKFYYQYGGAWCKIQDSASATCEWRPNKAGKYLIYVDIKDESGKVVTCRTISMTFNDPFSFTTTASSLTQPTGTGIDLRADGGTSYKFYYEKDGAWVRIQDYSSKDICTWKPTVPGRYNLFCDMKDSSGSVAVCKRITFDITEACTISADKTNVSVGENVKLSATGGASYKFYYELDGAWVRVQSFSAASTCTWKPIKAGDYMMYVDVNDADGKLLACKGVMVQVK